MLLLTERQRTTLLTAGARPHSLPTWMLLGLIAIAAAAGVVAVVIDRTWDWIPSDYPLTGNVLAGALTVPLSLLMAFYLIDLTRARRIRRFWTAVQRQRLDLIERHLRDCLAKACLSLPVTDPSALGQLFEPDGAVAVRNAADPTAKLTLGGVLHVCTVLRQRLEHKYSAAFDDIGLETFARAQIEAGELATHLAAFAETATHPELQMAAEVLSSSCRLDNQQLGCWRVSQLAGGLGTATETLLKASGEPHIANSGEDA